MSFSLPKSAWLTLASLPVICQAGPLTITATNSLPVSRTSATIEIPAKDLAALGAAKLDFVHIRDAQGVELVCQAIDLDGDALRAFDAVLFQADFAAGETKTFTATVGKKQVFAKEQYRAFGRFVRERFDDFAWENDRIAHRTYGKALETWQGEPLTSSTIDIWSKRTPHLVINDWYLTDDYHADHGDGADFYAAGASRGCGGSGIWADGKLWVSKNFTASNVLANGPVRVLFELEYQPFAVGDQMVGETKRISLDAGQQFDRFESSYRGATGPLTVAIGLRKTAGEKLAEDTAQGWVTKWETVSKNSGQQGLAIVVRPQDFQKRGEDPLNQLVLEKPSDTHRAVYWAGFCWDKAGQFTTPEAWEKHVAEFARELASPLEITVAPAKESP